MTSDKTFARVFGAVLVLCYLTGGGCNRSVRSVEEQESRAPAMQKARAKELEGDKAAAIALYQAALDRNPSIARAHLDMALLLDQQGGDYVSAIYHYKRYLQLRPQTEKRKIVQERIVRAEQMFASEVIKVDGRTGDRIATLQKEISKLHEQNKDLKQQLQQISKRGTLTQPGSSVRVQSGATAGPDARVYAVERGDTLASIAVEMYGDAKKWKQIADANHDLLGASDRLKVGQVLVIP